MARSLPPVYATLLLALIAHWWLWPLICADVDAFLLPWFRHIEQAGAIRAFGSSFGNYNPPYLYLLAGMTLLADRVEAISLIKALSVAGTVALAGSLWHLLCVLREDGTSVPSREWRAAALVLILPTPLINAALMAQCDAMWAAPCIMALAAAVAGRHRTMLAWCGVAVAFKLQAVFFAPFVLALLIRRRVPLRLWPIAALAWLASLLPAWLAGWPAADLLTIYLHQTGYDPSLALNAPNLWMILAALPLLAGVPLTGLAFAAAVGATATYVARLTVAPLGKRQLMEAALLAPLIVVGMLPRMHERYFFLADVIAFAIAVAWPDRRSIGIAMLVQLGSALGLLAYLSGIAGLAVLGAVPMIAATIAVARPLWQRAANDNPLAGRALA